MINIRPKYLSYLLRSLPNFLWPVKWLIMKRSLKRVGTNFKFGYNSQFYDHRLIEIGNNVFMGLDTMITTNVSLVIGNNVMFGPRVTIIGGDHNFKEVGLPMRYVKSGGNNQPIVIEDDVWVGANVTILKGVHIGEGAIIGAGSIVTKSVTPYSITAGNPCKTIKMRFSPEELVLHLTMVNSKYNLADLVQFYND